MEEKRRKKQLCCGLEDKIEGEKVISDLQSTFQLPLLHLQNSVTCKNLTVKLLKPLYPKGVIFFYQTKRYSYLSR